MITLSVKCKYGLQALFELACRYESGPTQIRTIAESQKIPQNYLEQLLVDLKRASLVTSFRGIHGGYRLARDPHDLCVNDVLVCLEGPWRLVPPGADPPVLAQFWRGLEGQMKSLFQVSFATLVADQKRLDNVVDFAI